MQNGGISGFAFRAALLAAACIAFSPPAHPAALEHVTVRLDWLPRAYQSTLYLAAKDTANSQGHGFGWMAPSDWAQTADLLKKYANLPGDTEVGALYTNQFLPKQ